ncbi:hypothetical protein GALMADRAFT_221964 [Galerina marginata CBS 339.88]|uniref:Uncharacterized protein n=1 Tax=Galerina marginata (strain CBS 339.88) TaxID=685588 RepID=A0A067TFU0_GALM3|nr:hypothetical protein GALMADRAFT_221964 [Galerina marginata CBS 339.88]
MSSTNARLPSINLARQSSDQYKTTLPNLSYPSRLHTHVSWSGPSAPLVISKTESVRYQTSFVHSNGSSGGAIGSSGSGFHASFEAHVLSWIKGFISHTTSNFLRILKNLKERLSMFQLPPH